VTAARTTLTLVAVAPRARSGGCAVSPSAYNDAVRDAVDADLQEVADRLRRSGAEAECVVLVDGVDPPLAEWIAEQRIGLVLLPARRRPIGGQDHPAAEELRRLDGVDVRVV
jgi:hypothetical protein